MDTLSCGAARSAKSGRLGIHHRPTTGDPTSGRLHEVLTIEYLDAEAEGLRRLDQTASGFLQTRLTPNITESAEFPVTVNVGTDGELVVPSVSLLGAS